MEKNTTNNTNILPENASEFLRPGQGKIYVKKSHTLEEIRSTASSFTLFGVLGIIFLVLVWNDIIYLSMESYARIIFTVVMGALFLFFLLTGIRNFFRIRPLKEQCSAEENQTIQIMNWFLERYPKEHIDEYPQHTFDDSLMDDSDEGTLYFSRIAVMKSLIVAQFPNLSEEYLDHLIEELYEKIF